MRPSASVALNVRGPGRLQRRPHTGFAPVSLFTAEPHRDSADLSNGTDHTPTLIRVNSLGIGLTDFRHRAVLFNLAADYDGLRPPSHFPTVERAVATFRLELGGV